MCDLYVYDLLHAVTTQNRELCKMTNEKFDTAEDAEILMEFIGANMERDARNMLLIIQQQYLMRLEELLQDSDFSESRSIRMRLAWLANTRPDCFHEIAQLFQVPSEVFNEEKREMINRINRAVKYAVTHRTLLRIPKLDWESSRVVGFTKDFFSGDQYIYSQLGYILLLINNHQTCVPLMFKKNKAKSVTRSAIAAEVIAYSDIADEAGKIAQDFEKIIDKCFLLQLLTHSKYLIDVVLKKLVHFRASTHSRYRIRA